MTTVIYMDHQMKLSEPANGTQRNEWVRWCPEADVGQVIATLKNPLIYVRSDAE